MAKVTIKRAIELSGKSRQTFYAKYLNPGIIAPKLDPQGKKYIDTADLEREFGPLDLSSMVTPEELALDGTRRQLAEREAELEALRQQRQRELEESRTRQEVTLALQLQLRERDNHLARLNLQLQQERGERGAQGAVDKEHFADRIQVEELQRRLQLNGGELEVARQRVQELDGEISATRQDRDAVSQLFQEKIGEVEALRLQFLAVGAENLEKEAARVAQVERLEQQEQLLQEQGQQLQNQEQQLQNQEQQLQEAEQRRQQQEQQLQERELRLQAQEQQLQKQEQQLQKQGQQLQVQRQTITTLTAKLMRSEQQFHGWEQELLRLQRAEEQLTTQLEAEEERRAELVRQIEQRERKQLDDSLWFQQEPEAEEEPQSQASPKNGWFDRLLGRGESSEKGSQV